MLMYAVLHEQLNGTLRAASLTVTLDTPAWHASCMASMQYAWAEKEQQMQYEDAQHTLC